MIFRLVINIIALLLTVPAFLLVMRYQIHMFQQNGYKNKEHWKWVFLPQNQQYAILLVMLLGLSTLTQWMIMQIVFIIYLIITVLTYRMMKKMKVKKKLVYTPRVKRLIVTDCILTAFVTGVSVLCYAFIDGKSTIVDLLAVSAAVAAILISFQPLLIILMNIINSPIEKSVSRYFINDARRMLREMPDLKIVGVTGSYGKTSVKFFLSSLLKTKYDVLITPESFNTPMGVVRTIREHLKSTHEIFVCEMGARNVGDIKELCEIVHPQSGVITSIGPQHLETFHSLERIINTKFELADCLSSEAYSDNTKDTGKVRSLKSLQGTLFLNGDNDYIRIKGTSYKNVFFYGTSMKPGEYYAKEISLSRLGTSFTIVTPEGETSSFQTKIIGNHNVINIVGAIAIAHRAGISLEELRVPVRRLQPVEHRLQMLERGPVTIIDDAYNSNPVGSRSAVETLAMFDGVRILITPGMVELGTEEERYNYEFGTYAAGCCDYVILVGSKRTEPIKKGLLEKGFAESKLHICERLEDAMSFAGSISEAGHKYILLENDLPDNY